jgi:hypothetical protein
MARAYPARRASAALGVKRLHIHAAKRRVITAARRLLEASDMARAVLVFALLLSAPCLVHAQEDPATRVVLSTLVSFVGPGLGAALGAAIGDATRPPCDPGGWSLCLQPVMHVVYATIAGAYAGLALSPLAYAANQELVGGRGGLGGAYAGLLLGGLVAPALAGMAYGLGVLGEHTAATVGWGLTAALGPTCALIGMAVGYELIDRPVQPRFAVGPAGVELGAAIPF